MSRSLARALFALGGMFAFSCGRLASSTDGSTSWLQPCYADSECRDGFECLCGTCSMQCSVRRDCSLLGSDAICVTRSALANACPVSMPAAGECLKECQSSSDCKDGRTCLDGFCTPAPLQSIAGTGGSGPSSQPDASVGGATGGSPVTGMGGAPSTGGRLESGGAPTGGRIDTGGAPTGGTVDTGGAPTGGTVDTGGTLSTGGRLDSDASSGGAPAVDGGAQGRWSTVFDSASFVVEEIRLSPAGDMPVGIAAGSDGNVWFVEQGTSDVCRITPNGVVTRFHTGAPVGGLQGITSAPDGTLWYGGVQAIGHMKTSGAIIKEITPQSGSSAFSLAVDNDGNVWFPGYYGDYFMGQMHPDETVTRYFNAAFKYPGCVVIGPDGNAWFAETYGNVKSITSAGVTTEFATGSTFGIATGPDGNVWFTQIGVTPYRIGRVTLPGDVSFFDFPNSNPPDAGYISAGPDGAMWFTGNGRIGRITMSGAVDVFALAGQGHLVGFAIGSGGTLWFSGSDTDTILRLTFH